jgi:hypothetical protein
MQGDQASIIGGAINYAKELEQLLQSLEARKRHDGLHAAAAPLAAFHYSKLINIRRPPYLRRRPTRPSKISLCPTATKGPRK